MSASVTPTPSVTATAAPTATPVPTAVPDVSDAVSESLSRAGQATSAFIQGLPLLVTRLLFAAAIIFLGFLAVRFGGRLLDRLIRQKETKGSRNFQQRETLRSLADSVFRYLMYFVIATMVLHVFGVDVSSLLAVAGISGVAIGFGAQTLVKDIISGIFLWTEGDFSVGDTVLINGLTGTVESIALRTTTLRDFNGDLYIVPNGDIRTVANESRDFKRAVVEVRLNYDVDIGHMLDVLKDEMQKSKPHVPGLREVPQIQGLTGMNADCLTVRIAALCDPATYADAERTLRLRIKQRFEQEGIQFPHMPTIQAPRGGVSGG